MTVALLVGIGCLAALARVAHPLPQRGVYFRPFRVPYQVL